MFLFTDGSVNTKTKAGCGAYLLINDLLLSSSLQNNVKIKSFNNTSSSRLEIETLLWALNDINFSNEHLIIYTDSQNIISLPKRRERLEGNNFYTKKDVLIKNYNLYKEFYLLMDKFDFELIKVSGHCPRNQHNLISKIFSIVDRASRKALRNTY